ncbi:hypothetical protein PIB30_073737 [Stylosanthes scabra]|uniref:Uncharacterized protein n=1 Tax=Stylosanthes scabra TaxID=79078 RepID=A0ABU6SQD7_9FABA|nr:hypothetical protein [Stylosanthes scabra]
MLVIIFITVPRTKFVGERPTSSRTRSGWAATAEREPSPFSEIIYDSREHYERSKLIRKMDKGSLRSKKHRFGAILDKSPTPRRGTQCLGVQSQSSGSSNPCLGMEANA